MLGAMRRRAPRRPGSSSTAATASAVSAALAHTGAARATVDLFTDVAAADRERRRAEAVLAVKEKFGKNALIKGTSLKEHALGRERNTMVGGHHG